jgi:hypothetical protein
LPESAIGPTLTAAMQRDPEPSEPEVYRACPDDEVELKTAVEDVRGGRGITLSPEELQQWVSTGEIPDSVKRRVEALKRARGE